MNYFKYLIVVMKKWNNTTRHSGWYYPAFSYKKYIFNRHPFNIAFHSIRPKYIEECGLHWSRIKIYWCYKYLDIDFRSWKCYYFDNSAVLTEIERVAPCIRFQALNRSLDFECWLNMDGFRTWLYSETFSSSEILWTIWASTL